MTATIPALTGQSTTDPGDYLVIQNTAANRTRKITYDDFKNELASDMDVITSAQLASALAGVTAAYQAADAAVKAALFPVGTKISASFGILTTTNPSVVLGFGTWVKEERSYYAGHKSGDPNFGTIGASIGGVEHNHGGSTGSTILNTNQIPAHGHPYKDTFHTESRFVSSGALGENETSEFRAPGVFGGIGTNGSDYDNDVFYYKNRTTGDTGLTQGHTHTISNSNHLPPTIVEVVWRRTA